MRASIAFLALFASLSALAEEPAPETDAPAPAPKTETSEPEAPKAEAPKEAAPEAEAPKAKASTPVVDRGAMPEGNAYAHDIGLTEGSMEDFEKVFVDPATFPGKLAPVAPPPVPAPTKISPLADGETGAGRTIKLVVANRVPKGSLTGESLATTLTEKKIGEVTQVDERTFTIVIGEAGLANAFTFALGPVKGSWYRLQDLGELSIQTEAAPEAAEDDAEGKESAEEAPEEAGDEAAEGEETATAEPSWVPLEVEAPALATAKGKQVLLVNNDRSAWADVRINGELAARIPPYGHGKVHGVAPGTYEVNYTVSNGYSWTRKVSTTAP